MSFPRVSRGVLAALCACALSLPVWAGEGVPPQDWREAKAALRRGDYRQALESFELIVARAPNDPVALLYRSLCQQRLAAPQSFVQLSSAQLSALQASLEQEATAQQRYATEQKAMERRITEEQARWDRELDAIQRAAEQERGRQRELRQREALERQRAERVPAKVLARPPPTAPSTGEPPSTPPPPSVPAAQPAAPPPVEPSTAPPSPVPATPTHPIPLVKTPELIERPPLPPGAIQIHARQMNVSPDRKIALAEGDVEILSGDAVMTADRVTLFTDTNDVYAEGEVRLAQGDTVFRGEMIHYNLNTHKGRFLQGTVVSPPWYEHGRTIEHIAEGVYDLSPGDLTSCDHEPPHFVFRGRRAIVFADDRLAKTRQTTFAVEQLPLIYLPWLTISDWQSPFFIIPGKKKPWEEFALMGYRYELDIPGNHEGTLKLDWRRAFGWGVGMDHQFDSPELGKALLRLYYNDERNIRRPEDDLPKGASIRRYRVLWRHNWRPIPNTHILTSIQKYSDVDFRKELLFREEFTEDDVVDSSISSVTSTPGYSLSTLWRKRMNRFQTVDELLPQVTFDTSSRSVGDSLLFSESKLDIANFQTRRAHSNNDTDVARLDWFQQFKYGLNLFRPVLVTPKAGVRQTYYTKDAQGGAERPQGKRDLLSGQFSTGADASLKLFRIVPITTNAFGLNINWLRHVLTPTVSYSYLHRPTVPNSDLTFAAAEGASNQLSFGLENKLQTKRTLPRQKKPRSFDLVRWTTSLPYTFHGSANEQGGRWEDWAFDVELYPWPWMRLETDWTIPSHFVRGTRDRRIQRWNTDLVIVGGRADADAHSVEKSQQDIQAPERHSFQTGPKGALTELLMPLGQWYLGLGHRYSQNDKTESVLQFDWRPTPKWEIGTFHRMTWKEVAGGGKRFGNVREYQYILRRDLHDWIAELVYRVDREFGEELYLTFTLKAYPVMPVEINTSYHQPKFGSQSSPFSPLSGQHK